MGKDHQSGRERAENHVSRPLSELRDPKSFGPPPKNAQFCHHRTSPTALDDGQSPSNKSRAQDRPSSQDIQSNEEIEQQQTLPTGPYSADTTGLSTANLPKPPIRRQDQDLEKKGEVLSSATQNKSKQNPSLPPRLPPRQSSPIKALTSTQSPRSPPPPYAKSDGNPNRQISPQPSPNQDALQRLTQAGVQVPELGISGRDGVGKRAPYALQSYLPKGPMSATTQELRPSSTDRGLPTSFSKAPSLSEAAGKKRPLPPKKPSVLAGFGSSKPTAEGRDIGRREEPPPIPLGTKPK